MKTYDFAIIGAGVFGAWTAHFLRQSGASVHLAGCLRTRKQPRQFRRRDPRYSHGLWAG